MANGTIAFDTLQTSDALNTGTSKTLDTSYIFNGVNKSWHWSSEPGNLSDSFNIASATDQGTGDNFITFTSNMSNATYPMPSAAQYNDISAMDESHIATNGFRHNTLTHAGSKNDSKHWAGILGDLA
jgi:hypothetical protein